MAKIRIKDKKKFLTLVIAAVAIIVAIVLVIVLLGGKKDEAKDDSGDTAKYDEAVSSCITELEKGWKMTYDGIAPLYENGTFKSEGKEDRVIEIKNVRIFEIKADDSSFKNVKYVVEFDLYSNRYRTSPYLMREEIYNTAIVYKDGKAELQHTNPLKSLLEQSEPDSNAVRELVANVIDLGDRYNDRIEID